jgi:two-component system phosphate regulon sensor histidine kinase PhoR
MKEKNLKITIGLMSIALIGLIVVQFYWIANTIKLEEKLFDYNVNESITSVVKNISKNESARDVVNKIMKPFDDDVIIMNNDTLNSARIISSEMSRSVSGYSFKTNDSNLILNIQRLGNDDSSLISVQVKSATEDDTTITKEKRVITYLNVDSLQFHKEKIVSEVVEDLLWITETKNVEERLNKKELNHQLKTEFGNKGIHASYVFAVKSEKRDTIFFINDVAQKTDIENSIYKARLFPEELYKSPDYLMLFFPNRTGYLLGSMSAVLILSTLFIMAIIFLYYTTVKILFRQKKITEIKNDLINNITHEFKTPISTISLASEALKEPGLKSDETQTQKYSSIIKEESTRLQSMVDALLETAMLEKAEYNLEKSEIDIHSIIEREVDRKVLIHKNLESNIKMEMLAINHILFADQFHITNIISNILDNAIKFSNKEPQIIIRTDNVEGGIQILVTDNGIGIDKNQQKKIFDTFYRVPTGNIQNTRGYGIGLSYVKKLVEAQGGIISVKSESGDGTTFKLFFPYGR